MQSSVFLLGARFLAVTVTGSWLASMTRMGLSELEGFLSKTSVQAVAMDPPGSYWRSPCAPRDTVGREGMKGPLLRVAAVAH